MTLVLEYSGLLFYNLQLHFHWNIKYYAFANKEEAKKETLYEGRALEKSNY